MPVTNLKPDTEDAEDEAKLLANYYSKKKYRQVRIFVSNISVRLKLNIYVAFHL